VAPSACVLLTGLAGIGAEPDVRRDPTVEAVERVMPCVVNIGTEEIVEYRDPFAEMFQEFWGPYYRRRPREARYSLGSGVIIDEEGYVLTNMHVVQRARKVWVQLADGREFEAKPIVGTTRSDVALLRLITKNGEKFRAVRFARDDDLLLGETVLALGNPFGLGGSVSRGILSSKNRRPTRENEPLDIADWLQTDAAINPGSSGGPLINLRGELIGLNVAIYREGQGIGFAIPIKLVTEALAGIVSPEVKASLWFGARLYPGPVPLKITRVQAGSPAEKAGLKIGDQVEQVNGKTPNDFFDAVELLAQSPKREATVTVQRGKERRTFTVRLTALAEIARQKLGLTLQELTPELAKKFGYSPGEGLLVADVEADGPAAKADLQAGLLITAVDQERAPDLLNATEILAGKQKGDTVELGLAVWQQRGPFASRREGTASVRVR
jgi:S1-C subfamily serine protease